jgi:hypothetical protein
MKIRTLIFALIAIFAASSFASAQGAPNTGSLEGTWEVTVVVTAPGFPPFFTALETYGRGGGLITSNNLPPVPRPGHGVWTRIGKNYSATIRFFTFDQNGQQNGSIKVRHTVELQGRDYYEGHGEAQFYDAGGNPTGTFNFVTFGQRLAPEPL